MRSSSGCVRGRGGGRPFPVEGFRIIGLVLASPLPLPVLVTPRLQPLNITTTTTTINTTTTTVTTISLFGIIETVAMMVGDQCTGAVTLLFGPEII